MNILSIQLGHNATIGIFTKKGMFLASQERFDYIKNSRAFPEQAIKYGLNHLNISEQDIDVVVVCGEKIYAMQNTLVKKHNIGLWDYLDYKAHSIANILRALYSPIKNASISKAKMQLEKKLKSMGFENIVYVQHHTCHAHTPLAFSDKKAIVITIDGAGDYYSGTVNVYENNMHRVASTPIKDSLGYVYSQTTQFLGMKALEHEYKVMGLAAYVKPEYGERVYKKLFKPVLKVDRQNLMLNAMFPTSRFSLYLKEHAFMERFDNIAYGVQKLTENVLLELTTAALERLGKNSVFLSGGVFMNVKANMKIAELDANVFFTPSCGDESNPIGGAVYMLKKEKKAIPKIKHLYLGPEVNDDNVEELIKKKGLKRKYRVEYYKDIEGVVAELIAKGFIVARAKGRCEWGARALGNRSILGDPSKMETFYKVNDQIKRRDFWMPFAPTILKEREEDYIINPNKRKAPYMILAFNSTTLAKKELRAAMHQGDKTVRPQVLEKSWNPEYYKIIKEFENITGIGGVLNTSFNLHGYPIAAFPEQCLHVFENSKLDYLALSNYLISRN